MKILKRSTCKPILPSSTSELTYAIDHTDKSFHIRITGNTSSGHFSHEWLAINDILECLPKNEPFKAIIFRSLYENRGANNARFLAAAFRNEGLLIVPDKAIYSHLPGDSKAFLTAMRKLVTAKTALDDIVGKELAAKEEMQKTMKKTAM